MSKQVTTEGRVVNYVNMALSSQLPKGEGESEGRRKHGRGEERGGTSCCLSPEHDLMRVGEKVNQGGRCERSTSWK